MIRVAILVAQDVQYEEFEYPYNRFREAGLDVEVILAPKKKYPEPTAKNGIKLFWNKTAQEVVESGNLLYDVIFIPGGWCPEVLRLDPEIMAIVRYNIDKDKIICAICHGTQVLLSAGNIPKNTIMTAYIGVKHDVENAGYIYPYQNIVVDRNILTCNHYKHNEEFVDFIFSIINGRLHNNLKAPIRMSNQYHNEYNHNQL